MTEPAHDRLHRLFTDALHRPDDERAAFLDEACGDDHDLRAELEALLAADADPAIATAGGGFIGELAPDEELPESIGGYRIVRLIGAGGMGMVYEAEQVDPKRRVALKVVRPSMVTRSLLQRFRFEAQVLGQLKHPGIAQIYAAGTSDTGAGGQPWFAMELVDGVPLDAYARDVATTVRARLALVARIADALQHAHQQGVIHRDLKPGNVLVDATGQPKILDFGVARMTDGDVRTTTAATDIGQLVGTIAYMSPEQAGGDVGDLDTRSDVYALGVVTYELLAGRLPYDIDRRQIASAVHTIREAEPRALGAVDRRFRGDLDTILGTALAKEKDRRYASAAAFADDIRRYLADEPIAARAPTPWYQMRKFARRNRALVAGGVSAVVALLAGTVVATLFAIDARNEADRANTKADTVTEVSDFVVGLFEVSDPTGQRGESITARELLDRGAAQIETALDKRPEVRAALMHTMGRSYWGLGLFDESEALHRSALAMLLERHGERHVDVARSQFALGEILHFQADIDAAEPLYRAALATREELLGPAHVDLAYSIDVLGRLVRDRGEYREAKVMHERAYAMRQALLERPHLDLAESLQSLGMVMSYERDRAAIDRFEEALAMRRAILGDDHPRNAELLHNIAIEHIRHDDAAQAVPRLVEAVAIVRRTLGPNHPFVAYNLASLGNAYEGIGDYAAAEAALLEAVPILEPGDSFYQILHINLGNVMTGTERYDEAEVHYQVALDGYRARFGDEHPFVAVALNNLGLNARDRGDLAAAEAHHRAALRLYEMFHDDDHLNVVTSRFNLGQVLREAEKLDDALPLLEQAYDGRAAGLGPDHRRTHDVAEELAMLHDAAGRPDDAERWRARLPESDD